MEWRTPDYTHVPLIHGPDGKKLSKRHGATAVDEYRDLLGYLPEGMKNYLLRLGWSHGDEEIIPEDKAIEWFGLDALNKAPARLDFAKLDSVNKHYMASSMTSACLACGAPGRRRTNCRKLSVSASVPRCPPSNRAPPTSSSSPNRRDSSPIFAPSP
jgi:glutamyl-tRNA synthetase